MRISINSLIENTQQATEKVVDVEIITNGKLYKCTDRYDLDALLKDVYLAGERKEGFGIVHADIPVKTKGE
jgi:hypothetical protein